MRNCLLNCQFPEHAKRSWASAEWAMGPMLVVPTIQGQYLHPDKFNVGAACNPANSILGELAAPPPAEKKVLLKLGSVFSLKNSSKWAGGRCLAGGLEVSTVEVCGVHCGRM